MAVLDMGSTKALGEDGFQGLFYQKCWHFIRDEVTNFCLNLLNGDMEKRMGKKDLMAVKLDMSKAYDRFKWEFIKQLMIQLGFANRWVEAIMQCVTTVSYLVVMNGHRGEKFQQTR
ncbi:hypothetical protein PVK06_005025 [Gossypium arboreum]|uniref:Reverse transcriptase domain-containing protein n=1 Tax=Gossypium arboreum TaxID=29729 RepID=A0ABR0QUT0_GOSAR|nr:hypothetical protein PVK06_005025 [Gossypium arboreum]